MYPRSVAELKMRRKTRAAIFAAGLPLLAAAAAAGSLDPRDQWPRWRGPLDTGVGPNADPPIEWAEDRNVAWKSALPGLGHASPVVWGERIYLTSAVATGPPEPAAAGHGDDAPGAHDNVAPLRTMEFVVLALERATGEVAWQRTVKTERPHEGAHKTGTWASASPVTDGVHLFAFFGSRGLYAMTVDGESVWDVDLGDMQTRHGHGEGASPALYGDTLVVNWDHEGDSFVVALDKATGKQRWKVARDEMTSWSTPLVVEHAGKPQVVIAATGKSRGYDLATGEVVWECGGLSRNVVASPVATGSTVIVANSYDWQAMLGIDLNRAKGDITDTDAVVWRLRKYTPYVPSPVLADGTVYFLRHLQGILSAVDAASGDRRFGPFKVPGMRMVFASPVAAAGRLYITSRNGATAVLAPPTQANAAPEVLAVNRLDDAFSASPALVGRELYLRGERSLYRLEEPRPAKAPPATAPASRPAGSRSPGSD